MRRTLAHRLTLALTPVLALLASCASPTTPVTQTVFVPNAGVRLATIERDTSHALVRRERTDVLLLEDSDYGHHGLPESRRTWLIELPAGTPVGTTLRFGTDNRRVTAWLLESRVGTDTHAIRAGGSVVINGRTDTGLEATVVLSAEPTHYRPGQTSPEPISVTRRATWVARDIDSGRTIELDDNEG